MNTDIKAILKEYRSAVRSALESIGVFEDDDLVIGDVWESGDEMYLEIPVSNLLYEFIVDMNRHEVLGINCAPGFCGLYAE